MEPKAFWNRYLTGPGWRYGMARRGGSVVHIPLKRGEDLAALIEDHPELDIYVSINPIEAGQLRRAKHVTHLQHVLIDIDPTEDNDNPSPRAPIEHLISLLPADLAAALFIVDSGRGVQAWLGCVPREIRNTDAPLVAGWLRWLAEEWDLPGWKIDTSTSDLSRLARVPGTINSKTGRRASVIRQPFLRADWDWLEAHAHAVVEPKHITSPESSAGGIKMGKFLPFKMLRGLVTLTARQFLEGDVAEGGRHKAAYAAAKSLQELGVESARARRFLKEGAEGCGLDWPEARRIWEQVYHSEERV